MKENVLFIAPHPDDETLGCGGTIFKHKEAGDSINWLLVTEPNSKGEFDKNYIKKKRQEINKVLKFFEFDQTIRLKLNTTKLETYPIADLTKKISNVFNKIQPTIIYVPFSRRCSY